jgi:hypothetical protein
MELTNDASIPVREKEEEGPEKRKMTILILASLEKPSDIEQRRGRKEEASKQMAYCSALPAILQSLIVRHSCMKTTPMFATKHHHLGRMA